MPQTYRLINRKNWNVNCTRLHSVINTYFFMPPHANFFLIRWFIRMTPVSSCTGDNLFSSETRRSYNFTPAFPLLIASIKFSVRLLWRENKNQFAQVKFVKTVISSHFAHWESKCLLCNPKIENFKAPFFLPNFHAPFLLRASEVDDDIITRKNFLLFFHSPEISKDFGRDTSFQIRITSYLAVTSTNG